MRLLKDEGHGNLSLVEKHDRDIPRYAILSHTWGKESEEVTLKDLMEGTGRNKAGYNKIDFCRKQASRDELQHFWVDTCCIDKSSSAELSEAINSMFRWYQNASKCYVYLSDVSTSGLTTEPQISPTTWKTAFRKSRWFSRGWTLQELLAPASVEFFSQEGDRLGSRRSLEMHIYEVTEIATEALRGGSLREFPVEERFSWAEHRETKRQEDKAYSLLGIFDIHMPLIYGEGEEKAFERLRKKISKSSTPQRETYAEITPFTRLRSAASSRRPYQAWQVPCCFKTSDYYQVMQSNPRHSHGTCEWFTRHKCYRAWWTSQEPSLLWYSADPGCGKSVVSRYLIEEVLAVSFQPLIYYFFPPGAQPVASIATALCAVLHQLYLKYPHLTKIAVTAFDQNGEQMLHEPWSLWNLLQETIQAIGFDEVICLFDGLDECKATELRLLADLILESARRFTGSQTRIKFILTSRPYFHIQQTLCGLKRHLAVFSVDGSKENENISQDVSLFIQSRVSELGTDLGLSDQERTKLKCKLTQNRNDSFLWAYLVTEELRKNPPGISLDLHVDQLPQTLISAYEAILNCCPDRKAARKILSIVLVARRPLSLDEMSFVLVGNGIMTGPDLGLQRLDRVSDALKHLTGLFLRIINSQIYLFHQTAREFLLCEQVNAQHAELRPGQWRSWGNSISLAWSHCVMTIHCVKSIQAKNFAKGVQGFQQLLVGKPLLAYAEQNWAYHASSTLRYFRADRQSLCIQKFIGYGLNMQMIDSEGKSLLHRIVDTHVMAVDISLVQHILSHGGLVTSADYDNMTCMHYAVLRANKELIGVLLNASFQINTIVVRRERYARPGMLQESQSLAWSTSGIKQGLNALHAAVYFGRPDIIRCLFECGVDVNAKDEDGHTALHLALCQSLLPRKKDDLWEESIYMLDYIEDYEEEGVEEIIAAVRRDRLSIIRMLCDHPAIDVSSQDNHARTPLHVVRYNTKEYGAIVTKLLIDRGADRLARDRNYQTPIHYAARAGDVRSLKILARKPEELMICDRKGRNALHFVAQSKCRDAASFVLRNALNAHQSVDLEGRNALHHALSDSTQPIMHAPWEMVHFLLKNGVCAKQIDHHGRDVLAHYITNLFFNADLRIVALLLVYGANGQYQDAMGQTLGHYLVCIQDEIRVTAWHLIQVWGLGSEALDMENRNILHHAAMHGSITAESLSHITRSLQVDLRLRDVHGLTALDYAFSKSHQMRSRLMFRRHRWKHAVAVLTGLE